MLVGRIPPFWREELMTLEAYRGSALRKTLPCSS
jgi:hypothetical protein